MSWDQILEHGTQLATSFALDCFILKAGEFALSPAGRAFMNDIAEGFKLPKAQAQECMVELAGIGKIALEEGAYTFLFQKVFLLKTDLRFIDTIYD